MRKVRRAPIRKAAPVAVKNVTPPKASVVPVSRPTPPKIPKAVPPTSARVEQVIATTPVGRPQPAVPATKTKRATQSNFVYQPPRFDFMDPARALSHAHLKAGMTIADLGAGSGFLSILAARTVGPTGVVYAVDILKENLRAVRSQAAMFGLPNLVTVWADLEVPGSTKIANESCDVVLLFKVLCQQQAHENTLREAIRIAKPGAHVVVTEWAEARFGFCPPERIVQKPQAIAMAKKLGLDLVEEHVIDSFHYMLEFTKRRQ